MKSNYSQMPNKMVHNEYKCILWLSRKVPFGLFWINVYRAPVLMSVFVASTDLGVWNKSFEMLLTNSVSQYRQVHLVHHLFVTRV